VLLFTTQCITQWTNLQLAYYYYLHC